MSVKKIMIRKMWRTRPSKRSYKSLLAGIALGLFSTQTYAVLGGNFELDRDDAGADMIESADDPAPVDWSSLFNVVGGNVPTAKDPLPTGFGPAVFIRDFTPVAHGRDPDRSVFTSGSSDVNDISSWSCTTKKNLGAKFDILNAYATAFSNPDGETILYFALERSGNEGTAAAGFWFLQDGTVACLDANGGKAESFTGNHQDGDLLVIADFTGGGKVSTVLTYEWRNGGLNLLDSGVDCADSLDGDNVCATVNQVTLQGGVGADIPWLTESKASGNTPSNDLEPRLFMEGGLNLTNLGLDNCFATFLATTRSSTSTTSEKHDYALGSFPLCKVELSKNCSADGFYNAATDTIDIPYTVTIENTGSSVVDSVVINDSECGTGSTSFNFGPLNGGSSQTQNGTCKIAIGSDLLDNPIFNGAEVQSVSDGVSVSLAESCVARDADDDGELDPGVCYSACDFDADPAMSVTKNCVTSLVAEDNVVKVNVNFSGSISNTSDTAQCNDIDPISGQGVCLVPAGAACASNADCEANPIPLLDVAAADDKAGSLVLLDAPGGNPLPVPVRLNPGDTAYYQGSYLPDGNGSGFDDCPSNASFDDTVTAEATDAGSGSLVPGMAMANCKLCPPEGCSTNP